MSTRGEIGADLLKDLQLMSTQLQLQQQHVKLIQDVAFKSTDNPDMLAMLHKSLRGLQCSQLLNHRAFEVGFEYTYVLELEDAKFYVGTSANLSNRLYNHFTGDGAVWTRKHAPLRVVEVVTGGKEREKEKTLQWMKDKGYENVRGYSWVTLRLDGPPRELTQISS